MDDYDSLYEIERNYVAQIAAEYQQKHLALRSIQLGLIADEGGDDIDWYWRELERLYWTLDALGAAKYVPDIESQNETTLAKRQGKNS